MDRDVLDGLLAEAMAGPRRYDEAPRGRDSELLRGGEPARQMISVEGGLHQAALFRSPQMRSFLSSEVSAPVRPSGERASYSIYAGQGAHLDIHRDVPGCDLALITCLYDSDALADGGALDLWLDDLCTPLNRVRGAPEVDRTRLVLSPGESMLLHGGIVPHRIPPLQGKRLRVVSLMCFEIVR
jgi:hypothetical protein